MQLSVTPCSRSSSPAAALPVLSSPAALNDFARGMRVNYPHVAPGDVRIVLVPSRARILPELSERLADYALNRLVKRGVTFKLNARVADARPGVVLLEHNKQIHAHTLMWTAGL